MLATRHPALEEPDRVPGTVTVTAASDLSHVGAVGPDFSRWWLLPILWALLSSSCIWESEL